MRTLRTGIATFCLVLVAAACSDGDGSDGASSPSATMKGSVAAQSETTTAAGAGATPADGDPADGAGGDVEDPAADDGAADDGPAATVGGAVDGDCPAPAASAAPDGPSAATEVVQAGGDGEPRVEMAVYPRPDHEGNPWSQWGQGIVTGDGRFFSAIGDHLGVDGNSYLYVYDPDATEITRFADVSEVIGHQEGDWGYGKVHAQMVAGACGEIYAATYWGTRREIRYNDRYTGDQLLRIDPRSLEVTALGAPIPEHGIPSMAAGPDGRLYVEAVDPMADDEDEGVFAVIDPRTDPPTVEFQDDDPDHAGFRSILVGSGYRAFVVDEGGGLFGYDPESGDFGPSDVSIGAGTLRAATEPMPDGTVFGITQDPEQVFRLGSDGEVDVLADVDGYTASIARTPDGSRLFWIPGAHGQANTIGTPVMTIDTATGDVETLVELDELARTAFGLSLGGTYDVAVDPSGSRLFIGLNAGSDPEEPWGEVVLAIVSLGGGTPDRS